MISFIFQKSYEKIRNVLVGSPVKQKQDEPQPPPVSSPPTKIFQTPDGRDISYIDAGSPTGKSIFFLHGLPGSRYDAANIDDLSKRHNVRMIGLDRPGMGMSTPQPGRALVDAVHDVNHLADHLGIEKYGVLGVSGGGPYALAAAATLPTSRLKGVSVVCGLGLRDMSLSGMGWMNWLGFTFGWPYIPTLSAKWCADEMFVGYPEEKRYKWAKEKFSKIKDPRDREAFADDDKLLPCVLRSSKASYHQGLKGPAYDGWLLCQPATFELEDIRKDLPIQLWYGKDDKNVGLPGETILQRLGKRDNVVFHLTDDTHASIFTRQQDNFVKDLADSMSD